MPGKKTEGVTGRGPSSGRADVSRAKLRERVKELTCLYGISQAASDPDLPLERKLAAIVRLLPPAWQYPGRACARIVIGEQVFETPGFREGAHRQTAPICIGGRSRGAVEIHYRSGCGLTPGHPFLEEERSLIENIAGQVALMIENEEAEAAKSELRKQLIRADRLAAIGQLAAGVAHELNEPLNTILGFSQLARKTPGLPAQAYNDIKKIEEASLHARNIIRELLIFARKGKPGSAPVNINRVVMDELSLFDALCAKSCVELRRVIDPDLPEITADRSQILQVVSNLIVNALQAMPDGGLLTLTTSFDASSVFLEVEDTGVGMSEEVRERLFLPFFTTKDVDQGTGLGLPVVHGIVTSHGGEIRVRSEMGKGTCFSVAFPVRRKNNQEECVDESRPKQCHSRRG
ncbi:MAG TPA: ATP-binding protein [Syntrophales bacterium]|nr:ATP-binding protein [Syntrophales bacterium]